MKKQFKKILTLIKKACAENNDYLEYISENLEKSTEYSEYIAENLDRMTERESEEERKKRIRLEKIKHIID